MKTQLSLAGLLTLLAACAHEHSTSSSRSDGGSGVNTVERLYGKTPSETYAAAVAAVRSFDLSLDRDWHDAMGGEVVGHRADGHSVIVKVDAIDSNNSRASVRVEPGDSNMAQMIHEKIADKLGTGIVREAFLSTTSEAAVYDADLESSLKAAERTAKALGWTVTGKEIHEMWAQLDARAADANPARFKITRVDDGAGKTRVMFIAGNGKTGTGQTMIARMREDLDRQLGAHAR